MSDNPAEFQRKTDAMFAHFERQLVNIAMTFIAKVAWQVLDTTPGPGLQYPPDTSYIATGRLRAAWHIALAPLGHVTRYTGGPYTDTGDETLTAIEGALSPFRAGRLRDLPHVLYLVNDVAYGYVVHWGLGNHSISRPWVENAARDEPPLAMAEAIAETMATV